MNLTRLSSTRTILVEEMNSDLCIPPGEVEANELYEATIYANTSSIINRDKHILLFTQGDICDVTIKFAFQILLVHACASFNASHSSLF